MAANRHARAFFTAERDLIFAQQRADVFESDGRLIHADAVKVCDRIDQVRGSDAAGCAELVSARVQQIVEDERQDVIRRDEGTIARRPSWPAVASPARALFSATAFFSGTRFSSDGSGPVPSKRTSRSARIEVTAIPFSARTRSSQPAPHPCTASHTKLPFAWRSNSTRIMRYNWSK